MMFAFGMIVDKTVILKDERGRARWGYVFGSAGVFRSRGLLNHRRLQKVEANLAEHHIKEWSEYFGNN